MADGNKNLGSSRVIRFYVEDKKLGRDFTNLKNWNWEPTYYEGDDEFLGPSDVEPWQRPKIAQGGCDIEEQDASYVGQVAQAIRDAELAGTKPKVEITEAINNEGIGTTSKVRFRKVVLKFKTAVNGKGEKVIRSLSFRSVLPKEE